MTPATPRIRMSVCTCDSSAKNESEAAKVGRWCFPKRYSDSQNRREAYQGYDADTTISAPEGLESLKQPRISGAALGEIENLTPATTPEPGSMALLAAGGLPLLRSFRRRRARSTA
jgi:hypothetical protein